MLDYVFKVVWKEAKEVFGRAKKALLSIHCPHISRIRNINKRLRNKSEWIKIF